MGFRSTGAMLALLTAAGCSGGPVASGTPAAPIASPVATADAGPAPAPAPEAIPAPPPDAVEIVLVEEEPLALVEVLGKGEKRGTGMVFLAGVVAVTLTNRWDRPVEIVHMDPVNLVFTRIDTGAMSSLVHPCEPGLLLGSAAEISDDDARRIEERSVVTLAPGEARTLRLGGDWGCGGGPWKPVPAPGRYRVEYRAHRWDPVAVPPPRLAPGGTIGERLGGIRRRLADPAFWDGAFRSNALEVQLDRPRVQRLR